MWYSAGVVKLDGFSYTEPGPRKATNEDRILLSSALSLYAVSDGMSVGHGALAAEETLRALHESQTIPHHSQGELDPVSNLANAFREANAAIFKYIALHPECIGMGATLTALHQSGDQTVVGHAGDSRCYQMRLGEIQLLTTDHALILPNQTQRLLTKAVGLEENIQPEFTICNVEVGDIFILCTDGLSDTILPADFQRFLGVRSDTDLSLAAKQLVKMARLRGSVDDASLLILRAN